MEADAGIPSVADKTFMGTPIFERTEDETIVQKLGLLITVGRDNPYYDQLGIGAKERRFL